MFVRRLVEKDHEKKLAELKLYNNRLKTIIEKIKQGVAPPCVSTRLEKFEGLFRVIDEPSNNLSLVNRMEKVKSILNRLKTTKWIDKVFVEADAAAANAETQEKATTGSYKSPDRTPVQDIKKMVQANIANFKNMSSSGSFDLMDDAVTNTWTYESSGIMEYDLALRAPEPPFIGPISQSSRALSYDNWDGRDEAHWKDDDFDSAPGWNRGSYSQRTERRSRSTSSDRCPTQRHSIELLKSDTRCKRDLADDRRKSDIGSKEREKSEKKQGRSQRGESQDRRDSAVSGTRGRRADEEAANRTSSYLRPSPDQQINREDKTEKSHFETDEISPSKSSSSSHSRRKSTSRNRAELKISRTHSSKHYHRGDASKSDSEKSRLGNKSADLNEDSLEKVKTIGELSDAQIDQMIRDAPEMFPNLMKLSSVDRRETLDFMFSPSSESSNSPDKVDSLLESDRVKPMGVGIQNDKAITDKSCVVETAKADDLKELEELEAILEDRDEPPDAPKESTTVIMDPKLTPDKDSSRTVANAIKKSLASNKAVDNSSGYSCEQSKLENTEHSANEIKEKEQKIAESTTLRKEKTDLSSPSRSKESYSTPNFRKERAEENSAKISGNKSEQKVVEKSVAEPKNNEDLKILKIKEKSLSDSKHKDSVGKLNEKKSVSDSRAKESDARAKEKKTALELTSKEHDEIKECKTVTKGRTSTDSAISIIDVVGKGSEKRETKDMRKKIPSVEETKTVAVRHSFIDALSSAQVALKKSRKCVPKSHPRSHPNDPVITLGSKVSESPVKQAIESSVIIIPNECVGGTSLVPSKSDDRSLDIEVIRDKTSDLEYQEEYPASDVALNQDSVSPQSRKRRSLLDLPFPKLPDDSNVNSPKDDQIADQPRTFKHSDPKPLMQTDPLFASKHLLQHRSHPSSPGPSPMKPMFGPPVNLMQLSPRPMFTRRGPLLPTPGALPTDFTSCYQRSPETITSILRPPSFRPRLDFGPRTYAEHKAMKKYEEMQKQIQVEKERLKKLEDERLKPVFTEAERRRLTDAACSNRNDKDPRLRKQMLSPTCLGKQPELNNFYGVVIPNSAMSFKIPKISKPKETEIIQGDSTELSSSKSADKSEAPVELGAAVQDIEKSHKQTKSKEIPANQGAVAASSQLRRTTKKCSSAKSNDIRSGVGSQFPSDLDISSSKSTGDIVLTDSSDINLVENSLLYSETFEDDSSEKSSSEVIEKILGISAFNDASDSDLSLSSFFNAFEQQSKESNSLALSQTLDSNTQLFSGAAAGRATNFPLEVCDNKTQGRVDGLKTTKGYSPPQSLQQTVLDSSPSEKHSDINSAASLTFSETSDNNKASCSKTVDTRPLAEISASRKVNINETESTAEGVSEQSSSCNQKNSNVTATIENDDRDPKQVNVLKSSEGNRKTEITAELDLCVKKALQTADGKRSLAQVIAENFRLDINSLLLQTNDENKAKNVDSSLEDSTVEERRNKSVETTYACASNSKKSASTSVEVDNVINEATQHKSGKKQKGKSRAKQVDSSHIDDQEIKIVVNKICQRDDASQEVDSDIAEATQSDEKMTIESIQSNNKTMEESENAADTDISQEQSNDVTSTGFIDSTVRTRRRKKGRQVKEPMKRITRSTADKNDIYEFQEESGTESKGSKRRPKRKKESAKGRYIAKRKMKSNNSAKCAKKRSELDFLHEGVRSMFRDDVETVPRKNRSSDFKQFEFKEAKTTRTSREMELPAEFMEEVINNQPSVSLVPISSKNLIDSKLGLKRNVARRGAGNFRNRGEKRLPVMVKSDHYLLRNLRRVVKLKGQKLTRRHQSIDDIPLLKQMLLKQPSRLNAPLLSTFEANTTVSPNVLNYCLSKNTQFYACKLCCTFNIKQNQITSHYKTMHPHSEVLISRLSIEEAKDAIECAPDLNTENESTSSSKELYECRFCGSPIRTTTAEALFLHLAEHTGEYRWQCPAENCGMTFLTIENARHHISWRHDVRERSRLSQMIKELFPIPTLSDKSHMYGYLCSACNYAQLVRSNVEHHVTNQHAVMTCPIRIIKITMLHRIEEKTKVQRKELSSVLHPGPVIHEFRLNDEQAKAAIEDASTEYAEPVRINEFIQCRMCEKLLKFSDFDSLFQHVNGHTMEFKWGCPSERCEETFHSADGVIEHIRSERHGLRERKRLLDALKGVSAPYANPRGLLSGYLCSQCNLVQILKSNAMAHISKNHATSSVPVELLKIDIFMTQGKRLPKNTVEPDRSKVLADERSENPSKSRKNSRSVQRKTISKLDQMRKQLIRDTPSFPNRKLPVVKASSSPVPMEAMEEEEIEAPVNLINYVPDDHVPVTIKNEIPAIDDVDSNLNDVKTAPTDIELPTKVCPDPIPPIDIVEEEETFKSEMPDRNWEADQADKMESDKQDEPPAHDRPLIRCISVEKLKDPLDANQEATTLPLKTYSPKIRTKPIQSLVKRSNRSMDRSMSNESLNRDEFLPVITEVRGAPEKPDSISPTNLVEPSSSRGFLPITETVKLPRSPYGSSTEIQTGSFVPEERPKCEELKVQDAYKKMLHDNKLRHLFKCMVRECFYSGNSLDEFVLHLQLHQTEKRTQSYDWTVCSYCYDGGNSASMLGDHIILEHGHNIFQCRLCFYRAYTSFYLQLHLKLVHKIDSQYMRYTLTCVRIGPGLNNSGRMGRLKSVRAYVCSLCDFSCYQTQTFRRHLECSHATSGHYVCHICKNPIRTIVALLLHYTRHSFNNYQCAYCLHGTETDSEMLYHMSSHHFSKPAYMYLREDSTSEELEGTNKKTGAKVVLFQTDSDIAAGKSRLPPFKLEQIAETEAAVSAITQSSEGDESGVTISIEEGTTINKGMDLESIVRALGISEVDNDSESDQNVSNDRSVNLGDVPLGELNVQTCDNVTGNSQFLVVDSQVRGAIPVRTAIPTRPIIVGSASSNVVAKHQLPKMIVTTKSTLQAAPKKMIKPPEISCTKDSACDKGEQHPAEEPICDLVYIKKKMRDVKKRIKDEDQNPTIETIQIGSSDRNDNEEAVECLDDDNDPTLEVLENEEDSVMESIANAKRKKAIDADDSSDISPKAKRQVKKRPRKEPPRMSLPFEEPVVKLKKSEEEMDTYGPDDVEKLPMTSIFFKDVKCAICNYRNKVRHNMRRHLLMHQRGLAVPTTAPTNPVPCLERNELMFNQMTNHAASSLADRTPVEQLTSADIGRLPGFVKEQFRFKCGEKDCCYITTDGHMLKQHITTLHTDANNKYTCPHCAETVPEHIRIVSLDEIASHLKHHETKLFRCAHCEYCHFLKQAVEKHIFDDHPDRRNFVHVVREPEESSEKGPRKKTEEFNMYYCNICSNFRNPDRAELFKHLLKSHKTRDKFKCDRCGVTGRTLGIVKGHIERDHMGCKAQVERTYRQQGNANVAVKDTTPIWTPTWQRNMPRLIRGIPIDDEESSMTLEDLEPVNDLSKIKSPTGGAGAKKTARSKGMLVCRLCFNFRTDSEDKLRAHTYEELTYVQFTCSKCSHKVYSREQGEQHVSACHAGMDAQLIAAESNPEIETQINKAIAAQRSARKTATRVSPNAKKKAQSKSPVKASWADSRNPRARKLNVEKCNYCDFRSIPLAVKQHQKFNHSSDPVHCIHCGSEFVTVRHLQNHMDASHKWAPQVNTSNNQMWLDEMTHTCGECGHHEDSFAALETHMETHFGKMPCLIFRHLNLSYTCVYCPDVRALDSKETFLSHWAECHEQFNLSAVAKVGGVVMHGVGSFHCPMCKYTCWERKECENHIVEVHYNPNRCVTCKLLCNSSIELESHCNVLNHEMECDVAQEVIDEAKKSVYFRKKGTWMMPPLKRVGSGSLVKESGSAPKKKATARKSTTPFPADYNK